MSLAWLHTVQAMELDVRLQKASADAEQQAEEARKAVAAAAAAAAAVPPPIAGAAHLQQQQPGAAEPLANGDSGMLMHGVRRSATGFMATLSESLGGAAAVAVAAIGGPEHVPGAPPHGVVPGAPAQETELERKTRELQAKQQQLMQERRRQEEERLLAALSSPLGYHKGKPLAALIVFRCCLQWRAFQADRTSVFDRIIQVRGMVWGCGGGGGRGGAQGWIMGVRGVGVALLRSALDEYTKLVKFDSMTLITYHDSDQMVYKYMCIHSTCAVDCSTCFTGCPLSPALPDHPPCLPCLPDGAHALTQVIGSQIERRQEDNACLAYWLTNTVTLLHLLQRNIKPASSGAAGVKRVAAAGRNLMGGLFGRSPAAGGCGLGWRAAWVGWRGAWVGGTHTHTDVRAGRCCVVVQQHVLLTQAPDILPVPCAKYTQTCTCVLLQARAHTPAPSSSPSLPPFLPRSSSSLPPSLPPYNLQARPQSMAEQLVVSGWWRQSTLPCCSSSSWMLLCKRSSLSCVIT